MFFPNRLYEARSTIIVFEAPRSRTLIQGQANPVHTLLGLYFKFYCNIILPSTPRAQASGSPINNMCVSLIRSTRATCLLSSFSSIWSPYTDTYSSTSAVVRSDSLSLHNTTILLQTARWDLKPSTYICTENYTNSEVSGCQGPYNVHCNPSDHYTEQLNFSTDACLLPAVMADILR